MFQIRTNYNHAALKALTRALRKAMGRGRWHRILGWVAVGAAVLLVLLFILDGEPLDWSDVLALAAGIAVLAVLLWEDDLDAWLGGRLTYRTGSGDALAVFHETEYTISMTGIEGRWSYALIQAVCETDRYVVFLLDKRHGQMFDKERFQEGTPEAFLAFLTEKTGLPVKRV